MKTDHSIQSCGCYKVLYCCKRMFFLLQSIPDDIQWFRVRWKGSLPCLQTYKEKLEKSSVGLKLLTLKYFSVCFMTLKHVGCSVFYLYLLPLHRNLSCLWVSEEILSPQGPEPNSKVEVWKWNLSSYRVFVPCLWSFTPICLTLQIKWVKTHGSADSW